MARPVYPYELNDPDFSWLITSFLENHPEYVQLQLSSQPIVFIQEAPILPSAPLFYSGDVEGEKPAKE